MSAAEGAGAGAETTGARSAALAVVLAGGRARRMGVPKATGELGGGGPGLWGRAGAGPLGARGCHEGGARGGRGGQARLRAAHARGACLGGARAALPPARG